MSPRKSPEGPEGKIFEFLKVAKCDDSIPQPNVPGKVRKRQVVVLERVSGQVGVVKCMAITNTARPKDGKFLPICPNPKGSYPMQVQLDYGPEQYFSNGQRAPQAIQLKNYSFLKITECYEVSLAYLRPHLDENGAQFKIRMKKKGGLGDLKAYLRKAENQRAKEQIMLQQTPSTQSPGLLLGVLMKDRPDVMAEWSGTLRRSVNGTDVERTEVVGAKTASYTIDAGVQTSHLEKDPGVSEEPPTTIEAKLVRKAVSRATTMDEEAWEVVPDDKDINVLRAFVQWASQNSLVNRLTWEERLDEYCRQGLVGSPI
ncbi:hypothetical protein GLAREA_01777 [Glarea lozoyensis ATCC 20868]|uniref:Uncharacterized protein n=1 Tax=Glarea lozoyensis (strain ATCC 20868 / MF5171) TaxID=1116229 RepID=S3CJ95_GLAL2|nr:uncharacterized protein GLAREA_01777 [Glarea lozoyensis ATCC 20868]EPE25865.1 hypothetical protein GLAREA_01777 [Glarea lozoyensis ATCC 20868]